MEHSDTLYIAIVTGNGFVGKNPYMAHYLSPEIESHVGLPKAFRGKGAIGDGTGTADKGLVKVSKNKYRTMSHIHQAIGERKRSIVSKGEVCC